MPFPISIRARCRGCRAKSARRSGADWISSRCSGRRRPIPRRSGRRATRSTRPSAPSRWSGFDAAVVYTDEIERQLQRLEEIGPNDLDPACACIDRACRKLVIFLDELVGGAPPVPLKLFPEYEAMQRSRGVKAAAATDLFFPDLRLRIPLPGAPLPLEPTKLASHLVKQRRVYQTGLLGFLRGESDGARAMRDAAAGMERVSAQESARVFWWTVGAFFDAIIAGGLEPGFGAKQLAARLDLQIRRVVEGSAKVATRLRREVLYYVALSAPVTPTVQAVQAGFGLRGLIPTADALNADLVGLQSVLREVREQLGTAKNIWLKVTLGRGESLPKLKAALQTVHGNVVAIGNDALTELTASLLARLDTMPPSGDVSDSLAMEYATGILLAESAVENYGSLASNFPLQVAAMLSRLDAAQTGRPIPVATGPLIDGIFRRAQERILLAQVAREIQVNLRHMEQVLDGFFRDHGKRAELATLGKDSLQIRGALRMLEQDDAERLLGLCQEQIDSYANPDTIVGDDDLELLAESLSGLGFFIEAFEQQRPNRQRLIAPLLAKRLGEAPPVQHDRATETVEDAVEDLRNVLPTLVAEVRRAPTDAAARAELTARLNELVDDATLIDDDELVAQAQAALAELDSGGTVALEAAVTAIAESGTTGRGARSDDLGGDAAAACGRRHGAGRRTAGDLPHRGRRGPRCSCGKSRGARAEPERSRCAANVASAVSHAEGQRSDGRPHRVRRRRLGGREDPQSPARGGARGHADGACDDRDRRSEFPAVGRCAQGRGQRCPPIPRNCLRPSRGSKPSFRPTPSRRPRRRSRPLRPGARPTANPWRRSPWRSCHP